MFVDSSYRLGPSNGECGEKIEKNEKFSKSDTYFSIFEGPYRGNGGG
jgi:hypothetical protein